MVHGLRDSAWSLLPIAHALNRNAQRAGYRVLLPELRGHGASTATGAYAMPDFLRDLHLVSTSFAPDRFALFGHSLGGHITSKYSALFPERVAALVVVEGLGPPRRPHEGDPARELVAYREMLLARLTPQPRSSRPIKDLDDVVARLLRNNPRLADAAASDIAPHLVRSTSTGLEWAFDASANSVFIGSNRRTDEQFWQQVKAPVCVVSGRLSYEYWGREMAAEDFTGRFAEGELERRAANFVHHEHHWFDHSGHMVHYDEPARLSTLTRTFLEKHHE
jgi:pimeloyl-ACP methyl ester carboxylesterase